jgi:hypothetical protein
VLRAPCEAREGRAVTVDCEDGWRRFVDPSRLRFALQIVIRGDGRQRLDARTIEIVVPGLDGSGC